MLVSEQRVDRTPETPVSPVVVRPRRISSLQRATPESEAETEFDAEAFEAEEAPAPAPAGASSFADYVEARGAQGLAELLEAATAYTEQVEGRPHFSPPHILKKVAATDEGAGASREERLRVFGKLLRQGKIAKVRRGQYAITEASRYYDSKSV